MEGGTEEELEAIGVNLCLLERQRHQGTGDPGRRPEALAGGAGYELCKAG